MPQLVMDLRNAHPRICRDQALHEHHGSPAEVGQLAIAAGSEE